MTYVCMCSRRGRGYRGGRYMRGGRGRQGGRGRYRQQAGGESAEPWNVEERWEGQHRQVSRCSCRLYKVCTICSMIVFLFLMW